METRIFASAALGLLLGTQVPAAEAAQSSPSRTFSAKRSGLEFVLPVGYHAYEREIFFAAACGRGPTAVVLTTLSRAGQSEEEALLDRGAITIAVVSLPEGDAERWRADTLRDLNTTGITHEIVRKLGGGDAWQLEVEDVRGTPIARHLLLARGDRGVHLRIPNGAPGLATIENSLSIRARQDSASEPPAPAEAAAKGMVRMLYLVPKDRTPDSAYASAMARTILDVQQFYASQLDGKTFSLRNPIVEVVKTKKTTAYFTTAAPPDDFYFFWRETVGEALRLKRGKYNDPKNRWVIYTHANQLCSQFGTGGTSGVAEITLNDLRGLVCQPTLPICDGDQPDTRPYCGWAGGLGHELGHAFNLPHTPSDSCPSDDPGCGHALMWTGFARYPDAYLVPAEAQSLLTSALTKQFFRAVTLPPLANPCTDGCP